MKKKTIGWIVAVIVVVIIIIAASGGSDERASDAATEGVEAAQKEWVELISFSGSGEKKSTEFTCSGGKLRMRYDFQSDDYGACAIYVVKEGVNIMTDGGFPEVMLDKSEQGESNLSHLDKGSYYLNIMSANGKWTVVVEELK